MLPKVKRSITATLFYPVLFMLWRSGANAAESHTAQCSSGDSVCLVSYGQAFFLPCGKFSSRGRWYRDGTALLAGESATNFTANATFNTVGNYSCINPVDSNHIFYQTQVKAFNHIGVMPYGCNGSVSEDDKAMTCTRNVTKGHSLTICAQFVSYPDPTPSPWVLTNRAFKSKWTRNDRDLSSCKHGSIIAICNCSQANLTNPQTCQDFGHSAQGVCITLPNVTSTEVYSYGLTSTAHSSSGRLKKSVTFIIHPIASGSIPSTTVHNPSSTERTGGGSEPSVPQQSPVTERPTETPTDDAVLVAILASVCSLAVGTAITVCMIIVLYLLLRWHKNKHCKIASQSSDSTFYLKPEKFTNKSSETSSSYTSPATVKSRTADAFPSLPCDPEMPTTRDRQGVSTCVDEGDSESSGETMNLSTPSKQHSSITKDREQQTLSSQHPAIFVSCNTPSSINTLKCDALGGEMISPSHTPSSLSSHPVSSGTLNQPLSSCDDMEDPKRLASTHSSPTLSNTRKLHSRPTHLNIRDYSGHTTKKGQSGENDSPDESDFGGGLTGPCAHVEV